MGAWGSLHWLEEPLGKWSEPKPHPHVRGSALAPGHLVMPGRKVWAEVCGELLFPRAQHQHSTIYTKGGLGGCSGPLYCDED